MRCGFRTLCVMVPWLLDLDCLKHAPHRYNTLARMGDTLKQAVLIAPPLQGLLLSGGSIAFMRCGFQQARAWEEHWPSLRCICQPQAVQPASGSRVGDMLKLELALTTQEVHDGHDHPHHLCHIPRPSGDAVHLLVEVLPRWTVRLRPKAATHAATRAAAATGQYVLRIHPAHAVKIVGRWHLQQQLPYSLQILF